MKLRRAVVPLLLIMAAYLAVLLYIDAKSDRLSFMPWMGSVLPGLMGFALLSIVLRYGRWHWLMTRAGHALAPLQGFLAYTGGFAFTASPGKAGELMRIRYYAPLGVPAARVVAAFVYERAFDLLCVLALACLALGVSPLFLAATAFVFVFLAVVGLFVLRPHWPERLAHRAPPAVRRRLAPVLLTLGGGFAGMRQWMNWKDAALSFALGLGAWGLLALAFSGMLSRLGIEAPFPASLAIYPLSMLAGAASMIPGGLGSTEAAITLLLTHFGADAALAASAAITIRLATLWFAIALGVISVMYLETRGTTP